MVGFIVGEPHMRVERVPDHLVDWDDIMWPPERNTLQSVESGDATPAFSAGDLYHRHPLGKDRVIFVWSGRDPNGLPTTVLEAIEAMSDDQ